MSFREHFEKLHPKKENIRDVLQNVMANKTKILTVLESLGCKPKEKSNGWIEAKCPDHVLHAGHTSTHDDKFNVSPDGYTMCFTGNYKSNIVKVLSNVWRKSMEETIEALKNNEIIIASSVLEDIAKIEQKKEENKEKKEHFNKHMEYVYQMACKHHICPEAKAYFMQDGITEEALYFFNVFTVDTGIYQGRAIIPFLNEFSRPIGYVAVNYMGKENFIKMQYEKMHKIDNAITLEAIEERYKKAVYCPGFAANKHLFGLDEVLKRDRGIKQLMIVEGERDCIKVNQEGIDCVSIHGTHLSEEQFRLLTASFNRSTKILIGLDMDEAGRRGCIELEKKLKNYFSDVKILNFPDGKDPKKFNGSELRVIINN